MASGSSGLFGHTREWEMLRWWGSKEVIAVGGGERRGDSEGMVKLELGERSWGVDGEFMFVCPRANADVGVFDEDAWWLA